ncbi:uncharacterized protein TNCV_1807391 [Trichonephila clavipes]|nr:uncharacterized protein TNCV_1807391 [Trichonephila clavipes]
MQSDSQGSENHHKRGHISSRKYSVLEAKDQLLPPAPMVEQSLEVYRSPREKRDVSKHGPTGPGARVLAPMGVKEGRFVLGTFRSERMRVPYRSRQDDRLCVMLVLVHIDITPPHTPLPVFRRIGERTIPYSWRACKQLRHLCETALRSNGLFASMFDGLVAFAVDKWRHDFSARRVRFISRSGSPMKKGRFVLGTFRSERMRVPYRSCQDDRLRVMLVLVHLDITPPQGPQFVLDSV